MFSWMYFRRRSCCTFRRFGDASIRFTWMFFRLPVNYFRVRRMSHIMMPVPGPISTKLIVLIASGTISSGFGFGCSFLAFCLLDLPFFLLLLSYLKFLSSASSSSSIYGIFSAIALTSSILVYS